ncbi:hypothetical protein GF337_02200 [candidate division KSB1 bacterium]|nr:hypothetical protein [candidate division KSB1 bacterium]
MNYQKLLSKIFSGYSSKTKQLENFKNEPIENDEPLGRFILNKRYIRSSNNTVKLAAFMPARDLDLSVYRTKGLNEESIWKLAIDNIISKMSEPKTLHGRAEITPSIVYSNNLEIDPNNIPQRHANITKWPAENHEQKMIAMNLAQEASLKLRQPES